MSISNEINISSDSTTPPIIQRQISQVTAQPSTSSIQSQQQKIVIVAPKSLAQPAGLFTLK